MKLYARLENENGKIDGLGGNEYLDIDITVGNEIIEKLTVKRGEDGKYHVYNSSDLDIDILNQKTWKR